MNRNTFLDAGSKCLLTSLLLIYTSCGRKPAPHRGHDEHAAMEAAYCTNDIKGAENILFQYLDTLSKEESDHETGLDFDILRAEAHERLFLIYRKTGETNKMKVQFDKALEYLNRFNERKHLRNSNFTYQSLADAIERSESNLNVRWKKD